MNPWPDLRSVMRDIPWVIAGDVATRVYMPERATQAMDVLIRPADENAVLDRLQTVGYKVESPLAIGGWLARSPEGIELDILIGSQPWLDEALAHPRSDAAGYPVIDLPYLVLMKMESNRSLDIGDLGRLLGLAPELELDRVRQVVQLFAPQDVEDLESLGRALDLDGHALHRARGRTFDQLGETGGDHGDAQDRHGEVDRGTMVIDA